MEAHVRIRNHRVPLPERFRETFDQNNPDKLPKPVKNKSAWFQTGFAVLIVIAINVMSAGHIIPVMRVFFKINGEHAETILTIIGWSGFVGISMAIVFMMSQKERSALIRVAILLAFIIEIFMNVVSTIIAVQGGENPEWHHYFSGIALGFFIPCANLAFGEVMHNITVHQSKIREKAEQTHKEEIATYIGKWQRAYRMKYKRVGLTDEEIDALLRGDFDYLATEPEEEVEPIKEQPTFSQAAKNLAEQLIQNQHENESYASIQKIYSVGPGTVKDAKRYIAFLHDNQTQS